MTKITDNPDFRKTTVKVLANRAGQTCSNPMCKKPTSGPHSEVDKAMILGEAAHIRAARVGGARYDPNMTNEQRSHITNGIWLCIECARKIDLDSKNYPVSLLLEWKLNHEKWISEGKPIDINGYKEKILFDDKAGSVLGITETLVQLSQIEGNTRNNIISKHRRLSKTLLEKMHKETQKLSGIKPNKKFAYYDDEKQRKLISKQIDKLKLSRDEYTEDHVRLFLTSTWALDKYNKGLSIELENNVEYIVLTDLLETQTAKLSNGDTIGAVHTFKNTSLGLNSLMLFISYLPSDLKETYSFINKPMSQWKLEINQILDALIADINAKIRDELK